MKDFAIHGCIIHTPEPGGVEIKPDSYVVCENGRCAGVFDSLPEKYAGLPVEDYGAMPVTPGFTDLHLHAPQFANLGLGMDMQLLDWLDRLTFPEEARYADMEYADTMYRRFVSELRRGSTVRACIFATAHTEPTVRLMELMEKSGLKSYVGRVSMDRNSPDILREKNAFEALRDTEEWLTLIAGRFSRTAPMITPRFVLSCTPELMDGLSAIAEVYSLPVQSHLSETRDEVKLVRRLHPDCGSYGAVYDKYGLMSSGTVMAHCVYPEDADIEILKRTGAYIAHCPTSNTDLGSGIAPIRRLLENGVNIGLGSDISGGHTLDISDVIREAVGVSKHLERLTGGRERALDAAEAFYLATRGGGSFFGKCGSFEEGYEFDAVVFKMDEPCDTVFEKLIYLGKSGDVKAKYVAGKRVI